MLNNRISSEERNAFRNKLTYYRIIKDFLFISAGVISAGFGLKSFLLPNHFIDGGVTGISLLIEALSDIPLSYLVIIINVPFVILGYYQVGSKFAIKSILGIVGLAAVLSLVSYPEITKDNLLVSVFGGFFLGAGIGLAIRGGSVLDGTEVLAVFFSRRTGLSIGDFILVFNIIIFIIAAYLLSIETALYSLLTYLAASKTVDFVTEGVDEYISVTIISNHSEELREMITEVMGKGVTIYNGKSGFGKRGDNNEIEIVYCVITRLEIGRFQTEVKKVDPEAFMVLNNIMSIRGGMLKKRGWSN